MKNGSAKLFPFAYNLMTNFLKVPSLIMVAFCVMWAMYARFVKKVALLFETHYFTNSNIEQALMDVL